MNTQSDVVRNLLQTVEALNHAVGWLQRSLDQCAPITLDDHARLAESDHDALEAFTSRYARVTDILLQKVFRAIDKVELEEGGTLIDAINRAHKRGLVDSVDQVRELRELRNEIAHEYALDDLKRLFNDVRTHSPRLLEMTRRVQQYCQKYRVPDEPDNQNAETQNKR